MGISLTQLNRDKHKAMHYLHIAFDKFALAFITPQPAPDTYSEHPFSLLIASDYLLKMTQLTSAGACLSNTKIVTLCMGPMLVHCSVAKITCFRGRGKKIHKER